MVRDYHCSNCRKKLFHGSLALLMSKKSDNIDTISIKCDRCGKINAFAHKPGDQITKDT